MRDDDRVDFRVSGVLRNRGEQRVQLWQTNRRRIQLQRIVDAKAQVVGKRIPCGVDKLVAADRRHEGPGVIGGAGDGAAGADDGDLASHKFKYKRRTGKISSSAPSLNAMAAACDDACTLWLRSR